MQLDRPTINLGAYGLRLNGLGSRELLVPAPDDWPELAVDVCLGDGIEAADNEVTEDAAALLLLTGGTVAMSREPLSAAYTLPRSVNVDELVHPYLAVAATVASYWLGRETLHAGAVVVDGGAWAVVGGRGVGKSSTLALLAMQGYPVLCDDVLVVSGDQAFAGPRAVDLRADAANALGTGESVGVLGGRERWRLRLPQVDAAVPLRGWVLLGWGDDVSIERLAASERLVELAAQRSMRRPPRDPAALLALAQLPAFALRRPRGITSIADAAEALIAAVSR